MDKIYIFLGLFLIGIIAVVVLVIRNRKIKEDKELVENKTSAIIDQMSIRRAAINTEYIENDFYETIKAIVYSFYAQSIDSIPVNKTTEKIYNDWFARVERDIGLGIKRTVYNFVLKNAKVIKQDNSSMYSVMRIVVRANFEIDFLYNHITLKERTVRDFSQNFTFLNMNDSWVLEEISSENDLKIKKIA